MLPMFHSNPLSYPFTLQVLFPSTQNTYLCKSFWEVFKLFCLMQIVSPQKEENLQKGQTLIKWLLSIGCLPWNYLDTGHRRCTVEPPRSSRWRGRHQSLFTTKHLTFAVKLLWCRPTLGSCLYCKNNYLCCFQFCRQVVDISYIKMGHRVDEAYATQSKLSSDSWTHKKM